MRRVAFFLGSIVLLLCSVSASAETRYVESTGIDNPDCLAASPCRTVLEAVLIADWGDTVSIGKGKFIEITGVVVNKDLTIIGAGIFSTRVCCTFAGYSVFNIVSGATVTITDLDVTDGNAEHGGGIVNWGQLTLERVRVRRNTASRGGGISNQGVLLLSEVEISNNVATGSSGGGLYGAGGLSNAGFAGLDQVRIVRNMAAFGAGGATSSADPDGNVSFVASQSEISLNSGDGFWNYGRATFTNVTISRNDASGIWTGTDADTTLTHVTIAQNAVGLDLAANSEVAIVNTIVADNKSQCAIVPFGTIFSAAGSLIEDTSCGAVWPGTLVGVDPMLQPLKFNGGALTFTQALRAGSPAIDAGTPGLCQLVDQRGVLRSVDGNGDGIVNCDIGAYEYVPVKRGGRTEGP